MAVGALELIVSVTTLIDVGASAERAHYHLTPTLLGNEITATLVIVEMIDEGDKGVEMFKCKSLNRPDSGKVTAKGKGVRRETAHSVRC